MLSRARGVSSVIEITERIDSRRRVFGAVAWSWDRNEGRRCFAPSVEPRTSPIPGSAKPVAPLWKSAAPPAARATDRPGGSATSAGRRSRVARPRRPRLPRCPTTPRREDPELSKRPGRRAQAGHRALRRRKGLDGTRGRGRSGGVAPHDGSLFRDPVRGRPPL